MPHFAFKFSDGLESIGVIRCIMCRQIVLNDTDIFRCTGSCGMSWCSQECYDTARQYGHDRLCNVGACRVSLPHAHPLFPERNAVLVTRSMPIHTNATDAIYHICQEGLPQNPRVASSTSGMYIHGGCTSNAYAAFVNLAPYMSSHMVLLNDASVEPTLEDIVLTKQETLVKCFNFGMQTAGLLHLHHDMSISQPSFHLFVQHQNDRMEILHVYATFDKRASSVRWIPLHFETCVHAVINGRLCGPLGGVSNVVFSTEWIDATKHELLSIDPDNPDVQYNLGARDWTKETVRLCKPDEVRKALASLEDASTDDGPQFNAAIQDIVTIMKTTLAVAVSDMLDARNDIDFFLFSIGNVRDTERIVEMSQMHIDFPFQVPYVHSVHMDSERWTEHHRRFPEMYTMMHDRTKRTLQEQGEGFVLCFETQTALGWRYVFSHWSIDLFKVQTFNLDSNSQRRQYRRVVKGQLPERCACCYKCTSELRRCKGCNAVRYCSTECQTSHWDDHKAACKKIRRAEKQEKRRSEPGHSSDNTK